jgi:hypothetical protein
VKKLRYEDDRVWVAEIEGIGCPVIALKRHNGTPTEGELGHVRMVLESLDLWNPSKYSEGTTNPGHYHVYVRNDTRRRGTLGKRNHNRVGITAEP